MTLNLYCIVELYKSFVCIERDFYLYIDTVYRRSLLK